MAFQETYSNNPAKFVREVMGIATCYPKQEQIMKAVVDHPRVAVRAPNGTGKSWLAAFLVVWCMTMFKGVRVVTTASTNRQVRLMWDTLRTVYARSSTTLGGRILQQEMHAEELGNHAVGYSTDDPGKFEGAHGEKRTLVVIDEAKSVPQIIFDAVERLLTSGEWVRLLVISSPGSPIGPFYDCFHRHSDIYKCFHIQMGESPYVRKEYVEERKIKWGEKSPLFLSSCMGEFSIDENGNIVIPLTYLQRIIEQPPEWVLERGACAGIDLAAGGGDESVFSLVVGNRQMELKRWNERDLMVTVQNIIRYFKEFNIKYGLETGGVNIDAGGLGLGVCDRLRELGYDFNRFNFGGSAVDGSVYYDAGAEVWDTVGRLVERREIALIDPQTQEQHLTLQDLQCQLSGRKTKPRSDGLIQLESKEEMRKRMLPSPDLGDATILSFAGRRTVNLRMENADDDKTASESDSKESYDEFIKDRLKKAQEMAEQIREERERNG